MSFDDFYFSHFRTIIFAREIFLVGLTIYLFTVRDRRPGNKYFFWGFLFITIANTFPLLRTLTSNIPLKMFDTYIIAVPFLALGIVAIAKAMIIRYRERSNTVGSG